MVVGDAGFSLKKFLFGKINRKLIFSFLAIVLLFSVIGFVAIQSYKNFLEGQLGETSVLLVTEVLDKINRAVYTKIEEVEAYSKDTLLQEAVIKSNKEFARIDEVGGYIKQREVEWVSAPEGTLTPFMQGLMRSELSEELRRVFLEFYAQKYAYPVFGEVFVTNKYGAVIATTGRTSDYYQADEAWWQDAKRDGIYVTYVEFDESARIYSISVCVRIDDDKGNFIGVIRTEMNLEEVIAILKALEPEMMPEEFRTKEFTLLNRDCEVLYSTAPFTPFEISLLCAHFSEEGNHRDFFIASLKKHGEKKLFAHSHSSGYRAFAGLDWILVVSYGSKEIFAPVLMLRNLGFLVLLVAVILSVLIGLGISRSISNPVKQLHDATEEIERGNFKVKVDIKTGDELEQLGDALNKTASALASTEEERKRIESAKTRFLSITSHELRSPMTPMRAQLQMLVKGYFGKLNEKQQEALTIVLRNTERLDNIICDFLEISRIEAARLKFDFVKTNLMAQINSLVDEMKGLMPEKHVALVKKIGQLPVIECDPDRVMQVLRNLINNAIKFSKPNGKVEITAKPEKGYILFSVKDYGIGISKADQQKLFEPFFQVEQTIYRTYRGTGLGLAICKGIVESQQGKLWVESAPGKGSTFFFTVPFTPVKEMKPIKVLFSPAEEIEKKLEELFKSILGPIGMPEFDDLRTKIGLTKENLFKYIDLLVGKNILDKKRGDEFKARIRHAFGED